MKVFISADIEGISGITHWDEADPNKAVYGQFQERMTDQVAAACEGAVEAGASEILVKDAHWYGRNILADRLPRCARVLRGWSGHPLHMVTGLDSSFDAVAFVGYHSMAGSGGNPLAHTLSSSKIFRIRINEKPVSEFHLYAYAAGTLGVPTAFLSGDTELCGEVKAISPNTVTVDALTGYGAATIGGHPEVIQDAIRSGMATALQGDLSDRVIAPQGPFTLAVTYKKAETAYRCSHYPGAHLADDHTVQLSTDKYYDLLRSLIFIV